MLASNEHFLGTGYELSPSKFDGGAATFLPPDMQSILFKVSVL
jgi:hypothetical protein